jgi:hypothetical protein
VCGFKKRELQLNARNCVHNVARSVQYDLQKTVLDGELALFIFIWNFFFFFLEKFSVLSYYWEYYQLQYTVKHNFPCHKYTVLLSEEIMYNFRNTDTYCYLQSRIYTLSYAKCLHST